MYYYQKSLCFFFLKFWKKKRYVGNDPDISSIDKNADVATNNIDTDALV